MTQVPRAALRSSRRRSTPTGGATKAKAGKNNKGGPALDDPEVRQIVKNLVKGFRIGLDLEVIGQVVQTDADYVNGKRITLVEIDIEQLMLEGKKLDSLDKLLGPDTSIEQLRPYLKDVKGLEDQSARRHGRVPLTPDLRARRVCGRRSSCTTVSMCVVCGNMSTACTRDTA